MTGPGDNTAAAEGRRDGHFRASRADREQVIDTLKAAFVQERLTKEEFDARVGQALASRTYADLAALTGDIPDGLPGRQPREPGRVRDRPPMSNARKAAICVAIAVAVPVVLAVPTGGFALAISVPFYFMALLIAAAQMLITRYEKRSRGQLPPRPGQGGQVEEGPQPGQVGDNPALPGTRPDQTRADLRTHSSRLDRPRSSGRDARAPRGTRPVPGVA
jgi:hypothetical protein